MKTSHQLTGVAGEYFVAAELSRRGYIASLTMKNSEGIDVLVSDCKGSQQVAVQVKTSNAEKKEWLLSAKAEMISGDKYFYIFVNLGAGNDRPEYHIVPSRVVADYVRKEHRTWLKRPGKKGQMHVDTPMRKFRDYENHYMGKWELLWA